jgi:hypothetical protein
VTNGFLNMSMVISRVAVGEIVVPFGMLLGSGVDGEQAEIMAVVKIVMTT